MLAFVLLQNRQRKVQEWHAHVGICLDPFGHDPQPVVEPRSDIVFGQGFGIDIRKTREAGKEENIPNLFEPFANKLFFCHTSYLLFGKIASVHLFELDLIVGERIAYKPPVVAGHQDDHPETLHELGRGIGPAITLRAQITLPVGNEHIVDFTQGDI